MGHGASENAGKEEFVIESIKFGPQGGIRTPTPLKAADFESAVSAVPTTRGIGINLIFPTPSALALSFDVDWPS